MAQVLAMLTSPENLLEIHSKKKKIQYCVTIHSSLCKSTWLNLVVLKTDLYALPCIKQIASGNYCIAQGTQLTAAPIFPSQDSYPFIGRKSTLSPWLLKDL